MVVYFLSFDSPSLVSSLCRFLTFSTSLYSQRISSLHENVRLTLDLDSVLPDTPKACFVNDECCSLLQPEETNHLVHSKLRKPQKDMSKTRNATGIFTTEHGDPSATATTLKYPPPPPTPPQVPAYSHHANKRVPDRLLCVYICADPYCNTAVCRPADIRSELQDFDKIVKNPSFFFVPLPLIISREAEMRQAAKEANISIDRWNGSMLYRKWQEIEAKERDRQSRRGGNRKKHLQDEDDHSMITLHPVQNLAEAHMISPKIRWWHPWLTVSIRSFYNTGIIRVPGDCHGMEILLALEFFGILYTRQDQLVFDAPIVQQKVHHWSQYFAHRGRLAQWVAQKLRDEQEAQQKRAEHEQRRTGSPRRSFLPPLVFCTNPHTTKEGSIFTIDSHETPVAILEPTVDVADGLGDRKKDGTKDWMTSAKLVHDFFVPKIGSFGFDVEDALLCSPETIPSMMREDFSSYIQHILPDVEIAFLLKKICLVCTDFKQTREKEKFRYSETLQRAILIVAYNPLRSRRPSRDASAQEGPNPKALDTSMTSMKSIQSNQSRRSVDPPGSTARYLQPIDEPKKVPSVSTTSSSYSTSSSSSSVTAAPTDEMTFGKLISGAHKAVARLLDLKVEEKAMGHGLRHDDSFYFYKEDRGRNKLDSAADTSGTSDDSLLSIYADRAARLNARAGERVEVERVNEESPKWKPEQKKTLNKTSIDSESALPENQNGRIVPSSREESISVEHIYEDLYRESMFPELSVPETYNELISSASPMWTPSLMRAPNGLLGKQDTAQLPTSVLVQSSLDILSVTSSVTRACAKSILDEDAVTVEEKVTAGDRRDKKVSTTSKVKSTTQKLPGDDAHDREFAARFEALLNENGEPYDEARRQQQLKQQKKKKFNAALNDLKLGFGAQNSEAVGSGEILPTVADSELDECQFLNGIYDMFATDDKPTDIVLAPPSGSSGAKSSSKANSAQSVRSELSSGFSTEETIRSPRRSVVDVMGLSNDAIKSATKILTQLTESTTAVATSMGVDNGSPHNKQSQLSFVCGTGPNEASVSRKRLFVQPKRRVEDEVEAKHGIEAPLGAGGAP